MEGNEAVGLSFDFVQSYRLHAENGLESTTDSTNQHFGNLTSSKHARRLQHEHCSRSSRT